MVNTAPFELSRLLSSADDANREAAWEELIGRHTRLLMSVARSFGGDHDDAMERYARILEKLREQDFRRLRAYDPHAGATFSTWLTVAARNFCLDLHRSRFGRRRSNDLSDRSAVVLAARRALNDLTESDTPAEAIADAAVESPDSAVLREKRDACLSRALRRLTPTERLLLTLRFADDLPASQIAATLGLATQFHVYRRLNGVLRHLRSELEHEGIDGPEG